MNTPEDNGFQLRGGVLMISYLFPPIKGIGTLRNYNVALGFKTYFPKVSVISTSNASFLPQQQLPDTDHIEVEQANTIDFRKIFFWLNRHTNNPHRHNPPNKLFSLLLKLQKSFPFNLFLDDGGLVYIFNAYRKACRIIKQNNIQFLYSSFGPYADHLVAYLLKKRFPHLKWIADFRDPFVDLNFPNCISPNFQRKFNRFLLKEAYLITTVSNGLAEHLQYCKKPVYVLRNGFNTRIACQAPAVQKNKHFTLSYTGTIYPERQTLKPLFRTIAKMVQEGKIAAQQVKLVYAGKDKAIWDQWISEFQLEALNQSYGHLSLERAIQIQKESQINILLSWAGPHIKGILTGKLYEYLAARRPILAIVKGTQDPELESIFASTNVGKVAYAEKDGAAIEAFIREGYSKWLLHNKFELEFNEDELAMFDWENKMTRFVAFLKEQEVGKETLSLVPAVYPI